MSNIISLNDFYNMLEKHDWFYHYSDDYDVYGSGNKMDMKLRSIAAQSIEHKALFDAYENYMYSGTPWGVEGSLKPQRPGQEGHD